VLFKLHPLTNGQVRAKGDGSMRVPLPDDKIGIEMEY